MDKTNGEVSKLQNHLALLRSEYVKLQTKNSELERKYAVAVATSGENENSFISRILKTIADLFAQPQYSDLKIKLKSSLIPAHKFVLLARSHQWGVTSLQDVNDLDWSEIDEDVGMELLKWIYTDQLNSSSESCSLNLLKLASNFCLTDLVNKCENNLISSVDKTNCIRFYMTANDIVAMRLKEHCSNLISSHWTDFTKEDFQFMPADILHKMLKSKSQYPLHDAIRIEREDVVFLHLVDKNAQSKLDEWDHRNDLPLDLALQTNQEAIAKTLIDHGANLNAIDSKEYTLLHRAILRDDNKAINFLLDHGASPSIPWHPTNESPLLMLCHSSGDVLSARKLIEKGADFNAQSNNGKTALHVCIEAKLEPHLRLLLENKDLDLECKPAEGHSALWLALKDYSVPNENNIAEILVEAGASPNAVSSQNQNSLLHLCSELKMESSGIFLCHLGADVNLINSEGESPLHFACKYGLPSLTYELINRGADPNKIAVSDDDTALHLAIKLGEMQCAESILRATDSENFHQAGSKPCLQLEKKGSYGLTPLGVALKFKQFRFSSALVERGSDVNASNSEGDSLLNMFIRSKDTGAVLFLLDNEVVINNVNTQAKNSPLFLAVENNLPDVVEALCKKGIDMSVTNEEGDCILWIALQKPSTEIASILVRYGIDTDFWKEEPDGHYQTLLHRSIEEKKEDLACFLIQAGCDCNSPKRFRDSRQSTDLATPLYLCAASGLSKTVICLLENGVQLNTKGTEGRTSLHISIQNHHDEITNLLLNHPNIDLSIRDKLGHSPFATAMIHKNNKAAQAILTKYPSAAEQYNSKGRNFLHVAIENKDLESVMFLLSIKIDVNCRTKDMHQLSALHLAVAARSELLVRNLLLAGANIHERTPQKYTALHIAAEKGDAAIISVLLESGSDFTAVDNEHNNALHVAVKHGNYQVCKTLLMESHINAESGNLKGQNAMHLLARYCKTNAVEIFNLFLECMPDYPINKPDVDGNTPLLLAYINGNGELCRALVKAKACLGSMNKDGITIFNYQVPSRQLLYRLLDYLSEEPPWSSNDIEACLECGTRFSITVRKHHCRHCGRLLCRHCSEKDIPIVKFNLNKPVRVCAPCFDVLALGGAMI